VLSSPAGTTIASDEHPDKPRAVATKATTATNIVQASRLMAGAPSDEARRRLTGLPPPSEVWHRSIRDTLPPMISTRTLVADTITPVRAYAALRRAAPREPSFLLESVVAGERWGRYSIVGHRARYEALLGADGVWSVRGDGAPAGLAAAKAGDPLAAAEPLFRAPDARREGSMAERLARAHFGYLAWDLVHALEKVPAWPSTPGPLAHFVGGAVVIVFDNLAQTATIAARSEAEIDQAILDLARGGELSTIALPDRSKVPSQVEIDTDDARFEAMVRRAQEYIAAGDAFQVVLSRTFSVPREERDPFDVYRALRLINPSPYMYFLDLPPAPGHEHRTQIAGASPETMVRLEEGIMTVRPIAGTRPRGKTHEEDERHARELLADPKERAEHVMLIDLGRNDIGRVAEIGSVCLARSMEIERYSHVMHIVSEVQGKVPGATPPLEVVRAAFPAGTLSGAPKVRAMQIIRELETRPREIYGGAVGYVTQNGDLDFAIAIRTVVCRGDTFAVTAGAGIVEASVPRSEAEETRSKARGALCAIEAAPH
jgi:anthranilate synthase component 1